MHIEVKFNFRSQKENTYFQLNIKITTKQRYIMKLLVSTEMEEIWNV